MKEKYEKKIVIYRIIFFSLQLVILCTVLFNFIPINRENDFWVPECSFIVIAVIFCTIAALSNNKYYQIEYYLKDKRLTINETHFITEFIARMRSSYSYDDFFLAISEIMELQADCPVIYFDCRKEKIIYQSQNHITVDPKTVSDIKNNYPVSWPEGFFFISDNLDRCSQTGRARGFFLSADQCHFFVFCRYMRLLDSAIYQQLFDEFCRFQNRMTTMTRLSELEKISHDWNNLNKVQQTLMDRNLLSYKGINFAAYYKPDIDNTSSFYFMLPLEGDETLIIFGDTAVKGLTSLLIMSLIFNTVQISENKHNIEMLISEICKDLSGIEFLNEYTSLFVGIINSAMHSFSYINTGIITALLIAENKGKMQISQITSKYKNLQKYKGESTVIKTIPPGSSIFLTSNNKLCRTQDFINTVSANAGAPAQNLINIIQNFLSANTKHPENSTLLTIKTKELSI
jgi:hypothetical protein